MIKALVSGSGGRMGGRIIAALADQKNIAVAGAFEKRGHRTVGLDAGEIAGIGTNGILIVDRLESIISSGDVIIDFTDPDATLRHVEVAAEYGKAMVIGTTGMNSAQQEELEKASRKIPIVFAPNTSVGVNLLFKVLADVAATLGDAYDVEIVEIHHRYKKDAPSGTARKMGEVVASAPGRDPDEAIVSGRSGMVGERTEKEIGIFSLRGGDVVGEHTVTFAGLGERIEFTHRAHSRDTFARGAVRAAMWISGRVPGLYDMTDVLGLKK
jgi:4-hydroxy-tetrahydrodipicolinate reductase